MLHVRLRTIDLSGWTSCRCASECSRLFVFLWGPVINWRLVQDLPLCLETRGEVVKWNEIKQLQPMLRAQCVNAIYGDFISVKTNVSLFLTFLIKIIYLSSKWQRHKMRFVKSGNLSPSSGQLQTLTWRDQTPLRFLWELWQTALKQPSHRTLE